MNKKTGRQQWNTTQRQSKCSIDFIKFQRFTCKPEYVEIMYVTIYCRTIYEKLGSAFSEDIQQLYLQQVEEITPNLRYCAYNIGDQSAIDELRQLRRKGGEDQLTSHLDVNTLLLFHSPSQAMINLAF